MSALAPGATLGFLGGGQLGRMTALAARSMGYRVHVLDPDRDCAAGAVADRCVTAAFDDADAARELARHCQVITLEIEQIATTVLEAAATYAPTRPGARVIGIIQDRGLQKGWLAQHGFPVGPHRPVSSARDIAAAVSDFGPTIVKSRRGGYDGRSQTRVASARQAEHAWLELGQRPAVAEQTLSLAGELSVMIARRPGGELAVFPVALNHHERQVLAWSIMPAPLPDAIVSRAVDIGRGVAEALAIEGVLCVELFLTMGGDLLVNELAPRPHNSFHATERACATSQFEQLTRAICDLPFGDTRILVPGAIVNLFGDLWSDGVAPAFDAALADPTVRLHLYGKKGARAGRKMGHLSTIGDSALDALARARAAAQRIGATTEDVPASVRGLLP